MCTRVATRCPKMDKNAIEVAFARVREIIGRVASIQDMNAAVCNFLSAGMDWELLISSYKNLRVSQEKIITNFTIMNPFETSLGVSAPVEVKTAQSFLDDLLNIDNIVRVQKTHLLCMCPHVLWQAHYELLQVFQTSISVIYVLEEFVRLCPVIVKNEKLRVQERIRICERVKELRAQINIIQQTPMSHERSAQLGVLYWNVNQNMGVFETLESNPGWMRVEPLPYIIRDAESVESLSRTVSPTSFLNLSNCT